jgi:glutamine amidotransferase-like uncharacterized protein
MVKPTIAVFIHQPMCSIQSGNGIINSLKSHYNFKIFTKHELETTFFDNVDMLAFPGGFGNSDSYDYLLRINGDPIREFVAKGGKYLGICMGAYWAGSHYFKLLEGVDAVQYYKRPTACTRRPHTKAMPVTWNGREDKMFFNDGCTFVGNSKKYETIATYANGEPMAIIQNNLGLIGCHPESEKFWYDSYKKMEPHWHDGKHHKLLLGFVDELMKR